MHRGNFFFTVLMKIHSLFIFSQYFKSLENLGGGGGSTSNIFISYKDTQTYTNINYFR